MLITTGKGSMDTIQHKPASRTRSAEAENMMGLSSSQAFTELTFFFRNNKILLSIKQKALVIWMEFWLRNSGTQSVVYRLDAEPSWWSLD